MKQQQKKGRKLGAGIELLVIQEFLRLRTFGKTSAQDVLNSLAVKYPDKHEREEFPSPQHVNKLVRPHRKTSDQDNPWTLLTWKLSSDGFGISPKAVPIILEIQRNLYMGTIGAATGHHWDSPRRISIREATWISRLSDIGIGQTDDSLDDPLAGIETLWQASEDYALKERAGSLTQTPNSLPDDDFDVFVATANPVEAVRRLDELMFADHLSLLPGPQGSVAVRQLIEDFLRLNEQRENEWEDEMELPPVTYGLSVKYRFIGEETDEWVRNDYLAFMNKYESVMYTESVSSEDDALYLLGADEAPFEYPMTEAAVTMALKQIPPRDINGNVKVPKTLINEAIVSRAVEYLRYVRLEIEKYIEDPENQRKLGIEIVDESEGFKKEEIFCLRNLQLSESLESPVPKVAYLDRD